MAPVQPQPAKSLIDGIAQDLIKFHKEQWRFYETQRQWLLVAFVTFSSVLTASFFASGTKDALPHLGIDERTFLLLLVCIDLTFCVLSGFADCKFVRLAALHEKSAADLVEAAIALQPGGINVELSNRLRAAIQPLHRGLSITAATYSAAIAVNLLILKVFALPQTGPWYYVLTALIFLTAMTLFSLARKSKSAGRILPDRIEVISVALEQPPTAKTEAPGR